MKLVKSRTRGKLLIRRQGLRNKQLEAVYVSYARINLDRTVGGGADKHGGREEVDGLAAGAALLLVWGAWSTLEGATQDQRIAPPPDLKSVVESVEAKGEQLAERALHEGRAEAQVPQ